MITYSLAPQHSDVWFALRRGRITGSKFKTARDFTKTGKPSAARTLYAYDVAREKFGGTAGSVFQTFAMKQGQEQEPFARQAYETTTGHIVHEVGFAMTECGMFGLSPDGEVRTDPEGLGGVEIKMMFGSENLFNTVIEEDYSEYMDQCLGYMLFLDWQWVDLCLWTPDLEDKGLGLVIHRIHRKDNIEAIAKLKADLDAFADLVRECEAKLCAKAALNVASMFHQEQEVISVAERERIASEAAKVERIVTAPDVAPVTHETVAAIMMPPAVRQAMAPAAQKPETAPTLALGVISERLGVNVTSAFLATLGFEATVVKAARLFHEQDFPAICEAIKAHISEVQEQFEAVAA